MTLEAVKGPMGEDMAQCKCAVCGTLGRVKSHHGESGRNNSAGRRGMTIAKPASAAEALRRLAWEFVKGNWLCASCAAARRSQKESTVTATKPSENAPRQPTPEQEVDIIVALSAVYDRKAKRYQGAETDTTVSEVVGGGCMPGWVAKIRAEKFGPAGNEEAEAIRAEIVVLKEAFDKGIAALNARIDALYRSEDKRVGGK